MHGGLHQLSYENYGEKEHNKNMLRTKIGTQDVSSAYTDIYIPRHSLSMRINLDPPKNSYLIRRHHIHVSAYTQGRPSAHDPIAHG
jgi:hypothetical protein